jgi:hypothetical protein
MISDFIFVNLPQEMFAEFELPFLEREKGYVLSMQQLPQWQASVYQSNGVGRIIKQKYFLKFLSVLETHRYRLRDVAVNVNSCFVAHHPSAAPSAARMAFVTLLLSDKNAYIEVQSLEEHLQGIKNGLKEAGVRAEVQEESVRVKVPSSDLLLNQDVKQHAILDESFGASNTSQKELNAAQTQCYVTLFKVLNALANSLHLEVVTSTWKQALPLALDLLTVLRPNMHKDRLLTAADPSPGWSRALDTDLPSFEHINWQTMPVCGFLLREGDTLMEGPVLTQYVRVTAAGRFTDLVGEIAQSEVKQLAETLGLKLIVAKDAKGHLLCYSLAKSKDTAVSALQEQETVFQVAALLVQKGWSHVTEGSERSEMILKRSM